MNYFCAGVSHLWHSEERHRLLYLDVYVFLRFTLLLLFFCSFFRPLQLALCRKAVWAWYFPPVALEINVSSTPPDSRFHQENLSTGQNYLVDDLQYMRLIHYQTTLTVNEPFLTSSQGSLYVHSGTVEKGRRISMKKYGSWWRRPVRVGTGRMPWVPFYRI